MQAHCHTTTTVLWFRVQDTTVWQQVTYVGLEACNKYGSERVEGLLQVLQSGSECR